MQTSSPRTFIFPIIQNLQKIIVTQYGGNIQPLQGVTRSDDPNVTYAATHSFLKHFHNLEFKEAQEAVSSGAPNFWVNDTFRQCLIRFVEADFYDNTEKNVSTFIVRVQEEELNSPNLLALTEEELRKQCPEEYLRYVEAKDYYEEAERNSLLKYFGILNLEISTPWKNHYEALYSGIMRQKGERWIQFTAAESQFPTNADLEKFQGFVLSGANHEAYDDSISWHAAMKEFIRNAYENYPKVKLLGVCFGCQILAHTLGGKAERMQGLTVPFISALAPVNVQTELKNTKFYQKTIKELGVEDVNDFVVVESHGDHVGQLPPNAERYGTSEETAVEMWGIEDRVFCVQFHPEFNESLMRYKILQEVKMEPEDVQKMKDRFDESLKNFKLDRAFQIGLCKNFLKP